MKRSTARRSPAVLALLALAFGALIATSAFAVDVRGTLRVPADYGRATPEPDAEQRRNHYWDEWNGFLDPRPHPFDAARELAVVLTGAGSMGEEQPGFMLANGALRPSTIVERAGATLRIQNTDPVTHQLFAEGLADFAPTPTSAGLVRQQVLGAAGDWPLRDRIYAHVRGHLHVLPDLVARATLQADGTFVFRNVPAGAYTLKVFHGARELHTAQVTVPEDRELVVEPIAIGTTPAQ